MFTKQFRELSKHDAAIAGGKGASLGEMTSAFAKATAGQADGHNLVPPGFVVLSGAFERFIEETDLDVEIDAILHTVKHEEMHTVENASERIQGLILGAAMPEDIAAEVRSQFSVLDSKFVAVRSSATAEDSSEAAWAGQLESYLNTTEKELLKNVQRCWASLFTPRAVFYRFEKQLHKQKISVAVAVQKMVESEVSGIAFSVHPVTEDYNQLIIEAGFGLGEAIVGGNITPDSYVVEKKPRRIIDKNISVQDRGLFRKAAGGNEWRDLSGADGGKQKLSDDEILKFAEVIVGIEKHYGFPCDIEWATEKGKFYILQSRPITTLSRKAAPQAPLERLPYVSGLLERKLPDWRGKEWYHQRFDGSPYFIHFIAEAEILYDDEKKRGGDFSVHYCFFEDGKADWYIEQGDIRRVYTSIIDEGKRDADISKALMKEWDGAEAAFYAMCTEVAQADLSGLSDHELEALHGRFVDTVLRRNSSSSIIDGFALGTDELVAAKIKDALDASPVGKTMKFTEAFSTLTAPVHLSFINDAEVALLEAAAAIKKDPGARNELLEKHAQAFFWIRNNYVDAHIISAGEFGKELDVILNTVPDPAAEASRIRKTPDEHQRKKAQLMEKLHLPEDVKLLLTISEDFTRWQDERKRATYFAIHHGCLILREFAKRTKLPFELLKYMSPREVSVIFEHTPECRDLESRQKSSVFYWDKNGHECVSGKEAERVKKEILGEVNLEDIRDFRGLSASLGKAVGKVKICRSVKEVGKVNEGDILVAVMTRPDYVPAMKKAAAIVTDEGGVTSHAAIVARELQKPCLIGTKIATKVLKDGDMVEVDANHGIVRILEKP